MLETRREQFFAFVREAKVRFRGERITSREAFDEAFAPESVEAIESAWRDWLRNNAGGKSRKKPGVLGG